MKRFGSLMVIVVAATMLDLITDPALVEDAWRYFREEQSVGTQYESFVGVDDEPAIEKNAEIMAQFKDQLEALYYDPSKYDTYLEQLGIEYPQISKPGTEQPAAEESVTEEQVAGDPAAQ